MMIFFVYLAIFAAAEAAFQETECTTYDHPNYGCSGQCMDYADTNCPGGNTMSGKCPSQANHVKCCFTPDSDDECVNYNHATAGSVGHCISTSSCPGNFYISNLCPSKPAGVKCCFSQPDNCADSSSGPVPSDCMACICEVESNCNENIGCRWDVNSDSCGPYQIKEDYYSDAQLYGENLGSGWKDCTQYDKACSERTIQGYMKRYATASRIGYTPECEQFARIHNGGPNGYLYSSTDGYWAKVSACL